MAFDSTSRSLTNAEKYQLVDLVKLGMDNEEIAWRFPGVDFGQIRRGADYCRNALDVAAKRLEDAWTWKRPEERRPRPRLLLRRPYTRRATRR